MSIFERWWRAFQPPSRDLPVCPHPEWRVIGWQVSVEEDWSRGQYIECLQCAQVRLVRHRLEQEAPE